MSSLGSSNISFSGLKAAYVAGGRTDAEQNSKLRDGKTNTAINLSFFRDTGLTDGTSIPSSGNEISINDFKGKTFGNRRITTDNFRAYSDWSTNSTYLIGKNTPTSGQGNTGTNDITNKSIQLISPQNSIYSTILISPNISTDTPGFSVNRSSNSVIDEATIWINLRSRNSGPSYGIIPLDTSMTGSTTTNKWNNQKSYIYNKHGNYHDRLAYNGGHFNFAGSRDDIISTTSVIQPNYRSGTYGSSLSQNFHNITGVSAGTMGSQNPGTLNVNYWFYTNTFSNFTSYNTQGVNLGFKVKWYETTLQCSLVYDSDIIQPVSPPSTWGDLTDVFSGMYISGTGINTNDGAFIGEIHTNYMRLYKGKGVSQLTSSLATSNQSNVTLTISGYLYWVLGTSSDYTESPKIIGPPHTVLPKYQATGTSLNTISEVEEWSFFVGDSTNSTSNYFDFDIRNTEPSGTAFSYSVSYSSGTVPSNETFTYDWKYYAYGSNIGITYLYWYSGSTLNLLRSISGQQHTSSNKSWNSYSEDLSSYSGQTGYIVYAYKVGSSYIQDPQFDEMSIDINGSTTDLAPDSGLWARNTSYTTSLSYPSKNWNNTISTSTSASNIWNLDSGGTPSGSTGTTKDASGSTTGKYLYFEGSSPNYTSSNRYYWFRSKNQFTLSSGGGGGA